MRILYFTFITPSERFGGGIAILQSLCSLCSFAELDYIGPQYKESEFQSYGIALENSYIMKASGSKWKRIWNIVRKGVSTSFYEDWEKIIHGIDASRYDCCFLDFTRQDFVVDWAKQRGLPIIVRAHNVEADYFEALYKENKSVTAFLHKIIAKRAEKKCVEGADKILALTPIDKSRLTELYGDVDGHIELMPVCVKRFGEKKEESLPEPFLAITGSLWFGPNADGTEWFLDKVWRSIHQDISAKYALVIAGANPNKKIKEMADALPNVHIYPNPEDIDAYYQQAYIYVAPIFYGAGMKVKIAEALSCGLPVVTTRHASAGYEAVGDLMCVGDDSDEIREHIEKLLCKTEQELEMLRRSISERFEKNYSLKESCRKMERAVKGLVER